jgi:hypothetical protein
MLIELRETKACGKFTQCYFLCFFFFCCSTFYFYLFIFILFVIGINDLFQRPRIKFSGVQENLPFDLDSILGNIVWLFFFKILELKGL